jgi:aldehyde:ferredoxin oxidoreductase
MYPSGGYQGKILRVDLSRGKISDEPISVEILRHYIGGTGLGIRLLYDELNVGIDPYSSANRLIFATGPLTGTLVPGSGTYSVVSRNTLTGLAAAAQANGFFGARLKYAGYDAVIIQGRSEKPVYLHVHDGVASIEDASDLRGKDTFEVDRLLRRRYGEKGIDDRLSVAAIGPAGENLVRFACIVSDRGHVAASGGLGAIMGSKNLKALVVHGNRGVPIDPADREVFLEYARQWRQEARETSMGKLINTSGTIGMFIPYHSRGWVPVKNLTTNVFPEEERFQADYVRGKVHRSQPRSCHGCTFRHCHLVEVIRGPYRGSVGEEVEYEILAGFGPNWGIYDPGAVTMLNDRNDRLGMDAKEATFVISMIMEGYEKGLIRKGDMDGLDPKWGNVDVAGELLGRISRREGFGDLLAEGTMRAAERLGGEFPKMAVYVKRGNAPHIHDPRVRWGTLFNQIVSNMGSQEGIDMTARGSSDLEIEKPTTEPDEYLGEVEAKTASLRQFQECLTYCYFQTASLKTTVQTLNCLTGAEYGVEDALAVGRRVVNLLRMFNRREGMTKKDDCFSPRLAQPPVDGPGKGKNLAPTFEKVLSAYYRAMGWGEDGMPTRETLEGLDLGFAIPVLEG